MSDKEKKDYDPTLLRAVGNILAGVRGQRYIHQQDIVDAVSVVLKAKTELKKQVMESGQ